jgi:CheY-like chemotaxis protein
MPIEKNKWARNGNRYAKNLTNKLYITIIMLYKFYFIILAMNFFKRLLHPSDGSNKWWDDRNQMTTSDIFSNFHATATIAPEETRELPISDCRVFLLEDNDHLQEMFSIMIEWSWIQKDNIIRASDVVDAKEKWWDNHFDVVILDHSIKDKNETWSDFLIWLLEEKFPSDGTGRPAILGNSDWFPLAKGSEWFFFKNPFILDHLKKSVSNSEQMKQRIQSALEKMHVNLIDT